MRQTVVKEAEGGGGGLQWNGVPLRSMGSTSHLAYKSACDYKRHMSLRIIANTILLPFSVSLGCSSDRTYQ